MFFLFSLMQYSSLLLHVSQQLVSESGYDVKDFLCKFNMVKFDVSGHFKFWQRVKDLLVQQNLVKVLYEKQQESMNITDWQELEARVVTIFRLCLDDDVMYHIMDEESPTTVWEKTRKSVHVQVIDEQTLS